MPRMTKPLTDAEVRAAKYDGSRKVHKLTDGMSPGLHVIVKPGGGKVWRLKYNYAGKAKSLTLGNYPGVSLAQARNAASQARALLRAGTDPSQDRKDQATATRAEADRVAGLDTFRAIATEWWKTVHSKENTRGHSGKNWQSRLVKYIFPVIGDMAVADIESKHIMAITQPLVAKQKTDTAHRLRTLCSQVLRYARAKGIVDRIVSDHVRDMIPSAKQRNYPAIVDEADLGGLLRAMDGYGGQLTTKNALGLLALLFVRPGELRNARWETFNLNEGIWNYEPSKGGSPLKTSLPRQAVELLADLHGLTASTGFVFPSVRDSRRPMSDNTLNAALATLGYKDKHTAHGFRASARTLLVERLSFPAEWVEMQMGHAVKTPNGRAYDRTTWVPERRDMLQKWADYLDCLRENVSIAG